MWIETQNDESTEMTEPQGALVWAERGFRIYHRPGGFFLSVGEPSGTVPGPQSTAELVEEILDAVLDAGDQEILADLQRPLGGRANLQVSELMRDLIVDAVLRYRQRLREEAPCGARPDPNPPQSPFPKGGGPASRRHHPPADGEKR